MIIPFSTSYSLGSKYARVDLPEPVEPTIATVFFPSILKVKSLNICSLPYLNETFLNSILPEPSIGRVSVFSFEVIKGFSFTNPKFFQQQLHLKEFQKGTTL